MHRCLHPSRLRGQRLGPSLTTRGLARSSSPPARFASAFPPPLHLTFQAPQFATTASVTFRRCYHGAQDAANAGARARPQDPPRRGGGGRRAAGWLGGGGRAVCSDALSPLVSFGVGLLAFFAWLVWAEVRPGRWGGGAGSASRRGEAPDCSFLLIASIWLCTLRSRGFCALVVVFCAPLAAVWGLSVAVLLPPPSSVGQLGCQPHDALLHHPYRRGHGAAGQHCGAVGRDAGHPPP